MTRNKGGPPPREPPFEPPDSRDAAEPAPSLICWRCGVAYENTTPELLARCTRLAKRAERDDVLHYTDAEVIEGWHGNSDPLPWLHRRTAGEDQP